jgi:hypothetical protein
LARLIKQISDEGLDEPRSFPYVSPGNSPETLPKQVSGIDVIIVILLKAGDLFILKPTKGAKSGFSGGMTHYTG